MKSIKFGFAVVAMACAVSGTAEAGCKRVTALGSNLTHDSAVLFSTNALKNTLAAQGLIGKGPVTTTCDSGSAMETCRSTQMACTGGTPKTCLGAWLCF